MTGLKRSDEFKEKQRKNSTGKKHTDETKLKIAASKIGKPSWNKGKPFSDETKEKMSQAKKGKTQAPEHAAKRIAASLAAKARNKELRLQHTAIVI
jgi:hypothetical protein